jgi:tyrosyl-tRNA synthetase
MRIAVLAMTITDSVAGMPKDGPPPLDPRRPPRSSARSCVDLKEGLAGDVTAAVHGLDEAMKAREEFVARFSKRTFADVEDLPTITDLGQSVTDAANALGFARSNGDVRRVAQQNGLRLVVETESGHEQVTLTADEAREPLDAVVKDKLDGQNGGLYLKVGRKLARITPAS